MKKINIIITILILISIAFAVTEQISTFSGQDNPFNITYTDSENQTFYLEIPMYAYVNNLTLEIEGISK